MFESPVNPQPRRELAQAFLAGLIAVCAASVVFGPIVPKDAGKEVSPWAWPTAGVLAAAALAVYEWHLLWRASHPPLVLDPDTLPPPFDWGKVRRRMNDKAWRAGRAVICCMSSQ